MKDSVPEVALSAKPALRHERTGRDTAFWIEALPEGHVLHVLAPPSANGVERRLTAVANGAPYAVRPYGPHQWFVVGDEMLPAMALREKAAALAPDLALSDQSHGRVRLAVSGPRSRFLLARGCAVDLSIGAFPAGRSAPTLFNQIGVHITRTDEDRFELIVLRSFAESLWEDLTVQSACL
jgi:sarcosine oxidase, subunit gamma